MLFSPLKGLLSAHVFFSVASLSNAQQWAGDNITTSLPIVPGAEIAYFNIKDANRKNTTLLNYMSLNSNGKRLDPKALKRAVIVVHGLNRDPNTYMSNMLSALAQVTDHPEVSTDSVAILAPYFTNGDDKYTGGYPWTDAKGSYTSALVWKGSQWASGANNQYPKTQTTVSSYAVLDQLTKYFDDKTLFPSINQIVIAGHSLGAQTVQRYCEVGDNLSTKTPVIYWVGNPNSYGWMSLDRPIDYSTCSTYDDWRDGLSSYTNTYGATLVAAGRPAVLANYNTKSIAYARGTLDLGDDSSGCGPTTTGSNRHERFFNFIKAFPPTSSCTVDYVPIGHDAGSMFASSAGKARLFLDNFDGAGSKAFDFGYPRLQAGDDPYPDPSQSSAVAPTSPGTFSGMTYQGCYSDPGSVLSLKAYSRDDNTIDSCTATCAGQGYKIAGLEYGVECWCGNSMGYKAQVTTDQACTMACAGNSTQICGNSYRLSVFSTGNITTAAQPSSPTQVGSYSLLGCYSEASSGRALSERSTSQSDMTVESCATYCSGYKYFGVEYGAECYCGNTVACSSVSSAASSCTMTCGGNSTEYCGNGGYLNLYALPSNTGPSACASSTSRSTSATSTTTSSSTAVSVSTTTSGSTTASVSTASSGSTAASVSPTSSSSTAASVSTTSSSSTTSLASILASVSTSTSGSTTSSALSTSSVSTSTSGSITSSVSTATTGATSSATSSATALACPAANGTTYTSKNRNNYLIECYTDHYAGDMLTTSASTLELCIEACDTNSGCVDVAWVYGTCYLKSSVGSAISKNAVLGAKLITTSSSSSSSSSSSLSSSTTAASSTTTSSPTTSSTSSSSATPSTTTLSCPTSDGTTFTAPRGQLFTIECGTDHFGGDMGAPTYPGSFAACVSQCDATDGCVDVAYIANGPCYLKSTVGASIANPNIWGAKIAASLPSGIAAKGCYVDDGGARAFPTQLYSNASNTPGLCAAACREKGFKYAGTQYGTECWCGPTLPATTAPAADCSSACAGDAKQKCGGGFRLSVTEDTAWTQKFFARQAYGSWSLVSCYQDNVDNKRTLATSVAIDASAATIAKCLDACAARGFAYCGAEYYYECYGGASKPADSLVVPGATDPLLAGCNYACSGNSTEACGGANKLLVYVNNGI